MAEHCLNCSEKITDGGMFGAANHALAESTVKAVNLVHGTEFEALCNKCGNDLKVETVHQLKLQLAALNRGLEHALASFPLLTVSVLPGDNRYRALGMVTGNVTVGTGLFNEFSQGLSDMFGVVNQQSGMALKVNKGEAAARAIIVQKAIAMGANCIIGVDIDYGTTTNNAATVNMQGTAIVIPDLAAVFDAQAQAMAEWVSFAMERGRILKRWLDGDIRPGDELGEAVPLPGED
ncbi:YbjQ family protein [Novosphingobium cyanobacteriorum]|uniref:Heavy metal-binding domain-containing protein n=1 Tax=Novosphingobium cyanobacteriorum TaxID=3024215 RepID=A0ABT6CMQ6_9SPHN|nr:heavy metal-binding domain-containing protein [Novosphingobium cyanobacteriorum]MDF8335086.1 heavy metal-binding domain-containing protein [Novosphingobium cyanobacteriorum]